jgi:hypothetical protein
MTGRITCGTRAQPEVGASCGDWVHQDEAGAA